MGIFSGVNEAPIGGNRVYFQSGHFQVQIDVLKSIAPEQSFKGKASFIAECTIVKSNVQSLPTGAQPAWVQTVDAMNKRSAFASIKQFFSAIYGDLTGEGLTIQLEELGQDFETHLEFACGERNPYRGMLLDLVCYEKQLRVTPTRPNGGTFTIHDWKPQGTLEW